VLSFSLDWTCVIAVENDEPAAASVAALADAHRRDCASLALRATSASGSLRDKTFPGSYELFEHRVKRAGLDDLPVLPPPAVWDLVFWDLVFWDRSYWVDVDKYRRQKAAIWAILFSNIEEEPWHRMGEGVFNEAVHTPAMKKWRNAWCDVHNLVTHIDHQRDVFVTTNTRDYQRNAERLGALGVAYVVTPSEVCALIESCRTRH